MRLLCVNNIKLPPLLLLSIASEMADYWCTLGGRLYLTHSLGWTPTLRIRKLGWRRFLYRVVQRIFRHLEPFRHDSQVWQTDGRTDGRTDVSESKWRASLRCAANTLYNKS